jgi:protein TonB
MLALIESGAVHARKPAASLLSVVVHAGLITAAVLATRQIQHVAAPPVQEFINFVAPKPQPLTIVDVPVVALAPFGFSVVIAPVTIPDVLPPIDPTRAITDPNAYTGVGVPGGRPDGVVGTPGGVFTANEVERIAQVVAGTAATKYPESLRTAGIEGDVILEFVIDAEGRVDARSIRVVSSNHRQFTDAALRALNTARFVPAELGGRPVPQLVRMPFAFKLRT